MGIAWEAPPSPRPAWTADTVDVARGGGQGLIMSRKTVAGCRSRLRARWVGGLVTGSD